MCIPCNFYKIFVITLLNCGFSVVVGLGYATLVVCKMMVPNVYYCCCPRLSIPINNFFFNLCLNLKRYFGH
jgi:hypothetical protein